MNLKGKTAVVTGGSVGIGAAIAIKLAECGANVAINYRKHKEEAEEVIRQIEKTGANGMLVKADTSVFADAEQMIQSVVSKFGQLDILVNIIPRFLFFSAGVTGLGGPITIVVLVASIACLVESGVFLSASFVTDVGSEVSAASEYIF